MSFSEQPLDDATINKFFADMPRDAMYLQAVGDDRIFEIVRSAVGDDRIFDLVLGATADDQIFEPMCDAGSEMVDMARGFYVWSKRKRLTSKERNANLRRVQEALKDLATALERLRADLDLRLDEGEPPASTAGASSTSMLSTSSASIRMRGASTSTPLTPNTFPTRLEPEDLHHRAKLYGPGRWGPNKGGRKGEAWAFAALVVVLAQQYERETGQIAKARGAFLERVRTEISRVERVHSNDALRKRVARALEKRAAWTSGVISSTSRSPVSAVQE